MTNHPLHGEIEGQQERRRGLLWLWVAVVTVLVVGLLIVNDRRGQCPATTCGPAATGPTASGQPRQPEVKAAINSVAEASSGSIQVTGSSPGGLAPGVTSRVVITVRNTGSAAVRVISASILVGDASAACTARNAIRTTSYEAAAAGAQQYVVAANRAAHIAVTISMLDLATNQDACQNARFPLTFHASTQQG